MNKEQHSKFLIVGVGNTLRGDDGIGAYVCSEIDKKELQDVKTVVVHQLHLEMLEEFARFEIIIIADATLEGEDVNFYPVKASASAGTSSHRADAGVLVSLAKQLYQKTLTLYICAVKAESFDIGNELTTTAKNNAGKAVGTICNWISQNS